MTAVALDRAGLLDEGVRTTVDRVTHLYPCELVARTKPAGKIQVDSTGEGGGKTLVFAGSLRSPKMDCPTGAGAPERTWTPKFEYDETITEDGVTTFTSTALLDVLQGEIRSAFARSGTFVHDASIGSFEPLSIVTRVVATDLPTALFYKYMLCPMREATPTSLTPDVLVQSATSYNVPSPPALYTLGGPKQSELLLNGPKFSLAVGSDLYTTLTAVNHFPQLQDLVENLYASQAQFADQGDPDQLLLRGNATIDANGDVSVTITDGDSTALTQDLFAAHNVVFTAEGFSRAWNGVITQGADSEQGPMDLLFQSDNGSYLVRQLAPRVGGGVPSRGMAARDLADPFNAHPALEETSADAAFALRPNVGRAVSISGLGASPEGAAKAYASSMSDNVDAQAALEAAFLRLVKSTGVKLS